MTLNPLLDQRQLVPSIIRVAPSNSTNFAKSLICTTFLLMVMCPHSVIQMHKTHVPKVNSILVPIPM